jgi:hypothetical protein
MADGVVPIVLLLSFILGLVALFAICRLFAIEKHMRRLVHIPEHQAALAPNEEFVIKPQAKTARVGCRCTTALTHPSEHHR